MRCALLVGFAHRLMVTFSLHNAFGNAAGYGLHCQMYAFATTCFSESYVEWRAC